MGNSLRGLLRSRLEALDAQGLLRHSVSDAPARAERAARRLGVRVVDAASNDYLLLARAALSPAPEPSGPGPSTGACLWGGAGASRLILGTHEAHRRVEAELAEWLGCEACLLFSSGFAANVGALSALPQRGDRVVSATLNHASLIDGIRLSRADVVPVSPIDLGAVERALTEPCDQQRWLVTESYFSMDGVSPDLAALRTLADRAGAFLVVDEAHAVGVFGPQGRGLCAAQGVAPDALTCGFGKAFGLQGGLVAGSRELVEWLWNRARSFVFSTASSPVLAEALRQRLFHVKRADAARDALRAASDELRVRLARLDPSLSSGHGPIVALCLGDAARASRAAEHFLDCGILALAIRPPTVPDGQSRLRLAVKADFDAQAIERIARAAEDVCARS